ncbi:hypothetical protein ACJJTC_009902 [Scirpophaga incertulas]
MLEIIHDGHLGLDRCKRRAREVLFWPGSSKDIDMRQPELDVGDDVIMYEQNNERTRGTITGKFETPRSYIVKNQRGVYRRNRRHLMKTVPEEIQSNESRNIEVCNKNNLQRERDGNDCENDKNKKSVPSDNLQLSDNKYKEDYSPPLTRMRAKKL